MKSICIWTLTISFILVIGCSSGESYVKTGYNFSKLDKIAVVSVEGSQLRGQAAKNQIGDFFAMELLKKGYSPIERSQIDKLTEEQKFQASDVTTTEGAVQAGRILNVPVVLMVNVPQFNEKMSFTAKMIDVENGAILWMGSGEGDTGKMLSTIVGAAAGAAAGVAVAGDESSSQAIGGIVGGVIGGVAGNALSPQQSKQARKVITKICESLPPRFGG
jgi:hypothetical protein